MADEMTEAQRYLEERRLQDLVELEDDPVLEAPNVCVDCKVSGSIKPVFEHPGDGEKRCDDCWAKSEEFGRRRLCDCEYQDEVFFDFHIRIGVKIKDRSRFELQVAQLRANEVLLGMPMVNDQESWEQELISVSDEDGNEVKMPEAD